MSASDAHDDDGSSVSINLSSAHKLAIYRTLYDFGLINATWDRTLAAIRRQRVLHDVPDDVVIPFVKQLLAAVAQGDAIASSDVIGQRRIEDLRRQLGLLQALWQVFVEGSGVVPPDVCATLQWQDVSKWWTRSHDILLVQNTFRSGYGPDHYQRLVDSNAADLLAPIKRHIAAQKLSGAEPSTSATMRYFTHSLKPVEARPAWGQRINDVFVSAASAIATAARKSLLHGLAFVATPLMTPILHGGAVTFTVNEASLSGAVVGFAPHSPHLALDTDIGKALAQCFVVKMPTTSAARPTTRSTSDGVVIAACSHTELDTVQTGLATGSVITIRCPDRDVVGPRCCTTATHT